MKETIEWQHRTGAPGYYVSADGKFQTLLDDDGRFLVCKLEAIAGKGFEIIAGPCDTLEELGVPASLVEAGDDMMLRDIVDRAKRGEKVEIQLAIPGAGSKP